MLKLMLENPVIVAAAVGVGTFAAEGGYYYYTLKRFPETYGRYVQGPGGFDDETSTLIDKVLHRINLAPVQRNSLTIFPCSGLEPVHRGSLSIRFGAVVGLPKHFTYTSEAEVTLKGLPVNNLQTADQDLLDGLKKTLVLTEREKAFCIAKEICRTNQMDPVVCLGLQGMFVAGTPFFVYYARLLLHRRSPVQRLCAYGLICASQVFMCLYTYRAFCSYAELASVSDAGNLTPFYAIGGLDYYTKALERNKLLRQMMMQDGNVQNNGSSEVYTASGNLVNDRVKLTERKQRLESVVEKWESGLLKVAPMYDRSEETQTSFMAIARKLPAKGVEEETDNKGL